MIEPLLLTTTRIATFDGDRNLTSASGFFFERDRQLWLVTSRHVLIDEPSGHRPNRIEIQCHTDPDNLTRMQVLSIWLYNGGSSGAPVVMRNPAGDAALPWKLLGMHSARMDMKTRDLVEDVSLGLNCTWYADILLTLTAPVRPAWYPAAGSRPWPPTKANGTRRCRWAKASRGARRRIRRPDQAFL
jgi:hypothetical protein